MSSTVHRAVWHPVTGVAMVCALAVLAIGLSPVSSTAGTGLTAFLAMGALAGFSVSGST